MKEMSVKTVVLCLAVGLSCLCGAETVATFTRSSNSSSIDTGAKITSTAFTVEMWLNPTSIESGDNVVFAQDLGGDAGRFNIVPRGGGTLFVQVGNNNFAPACPLPVGAWTHLAFTRDDKGDATLYTNGVKVISKTFNQNALSAANIILGRQDRSPGNGFNGLMGDVRVWKKCRTQAEINNFMRQRLAGDEEGLISYFRLDDGGANAPCDSARNVNGTFKNGASWTDDASFADRGAPTDNTALVFTRSASSAYVQTTNRITSVALTVEMWVKPRTIADADNLLFSQDIGGDKGRFNILLHGQEVWLHIGSYFPKVAYPVPTNKWTHIAFTRTGDGAGTIYANGDIIATANMGTDLPSSADIVIGLQRRSPGNGFDGQISEVRVWNYARTYEEIVGNKNRRLTGQEYGLVCLYPLNENFGAAYVRDAVTGYYAPVTFFAGWRETVNLPLTDELPPALRFVRAASSSSCTVVKVPSRIATVAFTIEAWVKPERFESGDNYLFSQDINGNAGRLIISQQDNGSTYYFQVGGNVLKPSGTLPVNAWTHLAFVRDANGIGSIYTNGQLLATGALNQKIPSAADFRIGRLDRIPVTGFIGLMSDVRVWSVAKTQGEIAAGLNTRAVGDEENLQFAYDLDAPSGAWVEDKVKGCRAEVAWNGSPEPAAGLPTAAVGEDKIKFKRGETMSIDAGVGIASDLFTVEAWVKPSRWQVAEQFRYLFTQENASDTGGRLLLALENGEPSFQLGDPYRFNALAVPTNEWTHLAFVREANGVGKIYTNGLLAATGTVAARAVSAGNLEIGNRARYINPYDGLMTDIRVWSTARTAGQIRRHFANRLAGDEKGLVAYWRCLENAGTTLSKRVLRNVGNPGRRLLGRGGRPARGRQGDSPRRHDVHCQVKP